jgi:PAT family beta-lactamase induction signal transducer AmpG
LFALGILPFSLKFITAPILEKYSNSIYGKRKTWIIIAQLIIGSALAAMSFYTDLT